MGGSRGRQESGNGVPALAVYGSLAPGEPNAWVLSRIVGEWATGTVRGYLFELTWGPAEGYQGFLPDPDGHRVPVHVLRSRDLERNWRSIDEFEGDGYDRQPIDVVLEDGSEISAEIYVARTDS